MMLPLHMANQIEINASQFPRAMAQGAYRRCLHILKRHPVHLLSFNDIVTDGVYHNRYDAGTQTISVSAIVGSVSQRLDFDVDFMPTENVNRQRWQGVERLYLTSGSLPPIDVYQYNRQYFVLDGCHRTSVCRFYSCLSIEANVISFCA